jgi:FkbM family methyltransferase
MGGKKARGKRPTAEDDMRTGAGRQTETIEFEIARKVVSFTFTSSPGLRPFVESVLTGADYPLVFPGIFEPHTIVDVGAHAGAATVYFKSHYPKARVFAFEPCSDSYEHLCANTRELDFVRLRRAALGARDGEARLYSGQHSSMQHSLVPNAENTGAFEWIPVLAARAALEALGAPTFSILKIDTEGCELEILESLGDLLESVDVIYLEYHSEADRLAIDRLLAPHFILYTARADGAHRGTNAYVRCDVLESCNAVIETRYVYPKDGIA